MSAPSEPVASLKPVFQITLDLEELKLVVSRDGGDEFFAIIKSGSTKSFSSEYPFNSTISHGRDDITSAPGGAFNNLDCSLFGETEDGVAYTIHYGGVVINSDNVNAVVQGKSDGHTYADSYVTNNMLVRLAKDAGKKYDWIKLHNLVGRGRFFRNATGFHIEYVMHIIV